LRTERPFTPLPVPGIMPNRRTKDALWRTTFPDRSMVAMAMGVLLKKRAKRTSAARWPSSTSSPGERLRTRLRDDPARPSGPKETRW
jgi:hypothetical protein